MQSIASSIVCPREPMESSKSTFTRWRALPESSTMPGADRETAGLQYRPATSGASRPLSAAWRACLLLLAKERR
jgi:hypothetical protein